MALNVNGVEQTRVTLDGVEMNILNLDGVEMFSHGGSGGPNKDFNYGIGYWVDGIYNWYGFSSVNSQGSLTPNILEFAGEEYEVQRLQASDDWASPNDVISLNIESSAPISVFQDSIIITFDGKDLELLPNETGRRWQSRADAANAQDFIDYVIANNGNTVPIEIVHLGEPVPVPEITRHPVGATCPEGTWFYFRCVANGETPLSYQWFKNGSPIAGETRSNMVLPGVTASDAGDYTCQVTSVNNGVSISNPATVVIQAGSTPNIPTWEQELQPEWVASFSTQKTLEVTAFADSNNYAWGFRATGANNPEHTDWTYLSHGDGHIRRNTFPMTNTSYDGMETVCVTAYDDEDVCAHTIMVSDFRPRLGFGFSDIVSRISARQTAGFDYEFRPSATGRDVEYLQDGQPFFTDDWINSGSGLMGKYQDGDIEISVTTSNAVEAGDNEIPTDGTWVPLKFNDVTRLNLDTTQFEDSWPDSYVTNVSLRDTKIPDDTHNGFQNATYFLGGAEEWFSEMTIGQNGVEVGFADDIPGSSHETLNNATVNNHWTNGSIYQLSMAAPIFNTNLWQEIRLYDLGNPDDFAEVSVIWEYSVNSYILRTGSASPIHTWMQGKVGQTVGVWMTPT